MSGTASTDVHRQADLLRRVGSQQSIVDLHLNFRRSICDGVHVDAIDDDPRLVTLKAVENSSLDARAHRESVAFVEEGLQAHAETRAHQLFPGLRRQNDANRVANALRERGIRDLPALRHRQERPTHRVLICAAHQFWSSDMTGIGMQILINAIQKKTMFKRPKKMFKTKNAQIVMRGMLKLHSQPRLSLGPPPAPFIKPDMLEPCIAPIRPPGTAKEQSCLRFCKNFGSVVSGNGTGTCGRPLLSNHAAMRNGAL